MNKNATSYLAIGLAVVGLNGTALAFSVDNTAASIQSPSLLAPAQDAAQQSNAPMMLAAGVGTRVERRHDAVDNTEDRIDDKQDFREERRDCVGDGPDCRSDNRQDKRHDTVDRAEDRVDDRRDRR